MTPILERLRATRCGDKVPHDGSTWSHVNPDGPEAADTIQMLVDHISEQVTFAETRIQDGKELGATVWRIALEDIARENRAALSKVSA